MLKKYITPVNIVLFLWGPILLIILRFYPDYTRYYLYLSIIVVVPFAIANLMKQRKEDKLNDTKEFQATIYSMLLIASILIAFFFITKQDHI